MEKVNTFAAAYTALGFKGKKKKKVEDRIIICPQCGKFMKHISQTNVFACDCGNTKLV